MAKKHILKNPSNELNLKLKYYDVDLIKEKDELLQDMAIKINSYMLFETSPNQAGYFEAQGLINRFKKIMAKDEGKIDPIQRN